MRYLREVPFLKQNRQLALVYFLSGPHETSTPNVIFVRSLGVADYKVRILKERLTKWVYLLHGAESFLRG